MTSVTIISVLPVLSPFTEASSRTSKRHDLQKEPLYVGTQPTLGAIVILRKTHDLQRPICSESSVFLPPSLS